MNVILYHNKSDKREAYKSLKSLGSYEGELKEDSGIVNPTILLNMSSIPKNANYAYIAEFGRYYYVGESVSKGSTLWQVSMSSDPLMTSYDQLIKLSAVIERQENVMNWYLEDQRLLSTDKVATVTRKFSGNNSFKQYGKKLITYNA